MDIQQRNVVSNVDLTRFVNQDHADGHKLGESAGDHARAGEHAQRAQDHLRTGQPRFRVLDTVWKLVTADDVGFEYVAVEMLMPICVMNKIIAVMNRSLLTSQNETRTRRGA